MGNARIPAHSLILAARSATFATMLTAPTKGTITKEVVLEDIEASVVKDLLHFLYGGNFEDTMLKENTRLIALLSATKRFGMSVLEKLCAEALKNLLQVSGRL